jgi:hypothetical protein
MGYISFTLQPAAINLRYIAAPDLFKAGQPRLKECEESQHLISSSLSDVPNITDEEVREMKREEQPIACHASRK